MRPGQPGGGAASVIHSYQERPERGVPDDAQRARIDLNTLAQVQMQAEAVRDDRFDDVAVRTDQVNGVLAEPGVPLPDRVHRAVLHLGHGLRVFPGEAHRAGMGLHHAPQRVLGQPLERLARPVPVLDLGELLVFGDRGRAAIPRRGDRLRGLAAAVQGAGNDRVQGHVSQPGCQRPGLRPATVVQRDTRRPARENVSRPRRQPMPHQQNQRHAMTLKGRWDWWKNVPPASRGPLPDDHRLV